MAEISNTQYFILEKLALQFILNFTKLCLVLFVFSNCGWMQCFAPSQSTKQARASTSVTVDSYPRKRGKSFLSQGLSGAHPQIGWRPCLPHMITCQLKVMTCIFCNWKREYMGKNSSQLLSLLFCYLYEKFYLINKTTVGKWPVEKNNEWRWVIKEERAVMIKRSERNIL